MKKKYIIPEIIADVLIETNVMLEGSPATNIGGGGDDVTPPGGDSNIGEVGTGSGDDAAAKNSWFNWDDEI